MSELEFNDALDDSFITPIKSVNKSNISTNNDKIDFSFDDEMDNFINSNKSIDDDNIELDEKTCTEDNELDSDLI